LSEENYPQDFLDYLSVERGLSPHTIDAYGRDISQYISWLKADFLKADSSLMGKYIGELRAKGYKASSISRKLSVIRMFYKFLYAEGKINHNPLEEITSPRWGKAPYLSFGKRSR